MVSSNLICYSSKPTFHQEGYFMVPNEYISTNRMDENKRIGIGITMVLIIDVYCVLYKSSIFTKRQIASCHILAIHIIILQSHSACGQQTKYSKYVAAMFRILKL